MQPEKLIVIIHPAISKSAKGTRKDGFEAFLRTKITK